MSDSSQGDRQKFKQGDRNRAKTLVGQWIQEADVEIIRHTPSTTSRSEAGEEVGASEGEFPFDPFQEAVTVDPPQETQEGSPSPGASESSSGSSPQQPNGPTMSDAPDDTEKWVEERSARMEERMNTTEERVGRWTDEVSSKIDKLGGELRSDIQGVRKELKSDIQGVRREQERLHDDNNSLRSNILNGFSIAAVIVVSLFTAILSRISSVQELVIENTRQVAQMGAAGGVDSTATGGTAAAGGVGWLVSPLIVAVVGLLIIVAVLVLQNNQKSSERSPEKE